MIVAIDAFIGGATGIVLSQSEPPNNVMSRDMIARVEAFDREFYIYTALAMQLKLHDPEAEDSQRQQKSQQRLR
jgi:hypothetical protein